MGLKDDLIKKANAKNSGEDSEQNNQEVDNNTGSDPSYDLGNIDFSSIEADIGLSDEPPAFEEPKPIEEPVSFSEPEPFLEPEQTPVEDIKISDPEPVFQEPFKAETQEPVPFQEPRQQSSFQDVMREKNSQRNEENQYQNSYNQFDDNVVDYGGVGDMNGSGSMGIKEDLLTLAKKTILDDISENFDSTIFTKESVKSLISSYFNNKQTNYSNNNALFASLLDEVLSNKYSHSYYGDLTGDVIKSVKSDINF